MSKFHSTVSRRDFMKGLGLAGVGLGAGAIASPTFHDLDEVSASYKANPQPWWVKEVETPTVEIDYGLIKRQNMEELSTYPTITDHIIREWGQAEYDRLHSVRDQLLKQWLTSNNQPGRDIKGYALNHGATFGWSRDFPQYFLGDPYPMTPERLGGTKYQGTPEENNKVVTAALKFYGAAKVGFTQLDDNTKKFIWQKGRDMEGPVNEKTWSAGSKAKIIEFEDVDQPYVTDTKKVIPNKFKNLIVFEIPQSDYVTRLGPASEVEAGSFTRCAATAQSYGNLAITERRFQRFMKCLGYWAIGGGTGALGPVTAWAVLSGLGEMSRMNPLLTPEWGTMIRSTVMIITDLPLVTTKPIDAGMFKFCATCMRCAEVCPYGAISLATEPTWDVSGWWNYPGKKVYPIDYSRCQRHRESAGPAGTGCDNCMSSCPFSKQQHAAIHPFVGALVSSTSIANGFLRNMDKAFGYGDHPDPEEWWSMNMPVGGLDSCVGTLRMR